MLSYAHAEQRRRMLGEGLEGERLGKEIRRVVRGGHMLDAEHLIISRQVHSHSVHASMWQHRKPLRECQPELNP